MATIDADDAGCLRAWMLAIPLLLLGSSWPVDVAHAQHPLEPPVTSSPQETLHTFMTANDALWTVVRDAGLGKRSREGYQKVLEWDVRAKRTLDLSGVAREAQAETADDALVLLYEVLLRIEVPPIDQIPGDEAIKANPDLTHWTVPHTEITVHRVADGPREGEFLFTPETVARAREFYERTKALPYLRTPPIEDVSSFVEVYGGWDIPIAWVDALPDWMRKVAWGQAVWKWILLAAALLATLVLAWLAFRWTRRKGPPKSAREHLRNLGVPVLLLMAAAFVQPYLTEVTLLTGSVAKVSDLAGIAVVYFSLAWISWILIIAAGEAILETPRVRSGTLDASLIRLTARLIAIGAVVILIFQGGTAIGLPLVGLVASLSIGGLAIALAAQATLKNLLGSLEILVDRPYRVGERIVAGGHDGVVERIGLRSTRIRELDGNVTSIPNERMAAMEIENVGRRGSIRRSTQLRIATGTPPEKVEQALQIVREILANHEGMPAKNPPRVYFDEFNPDSLSIRMLYWYEPPDFWAFTDFSERVNLEIVRRFAEAGIALAPPTSRTELADASGQPLALPMPSEDPPES